MELTIKRGDIYYAELYCLVRMFLTNLKSILKIRLKTHIFLRTFADSTVGGTQKRNGLFDTLYFSSCLQHFTTDIDYSFKNKLVKLNCFFLTHFLRYNLS